MREQEPDEELDSLDPAQSEDRMTVGNLTEGLTSIIEKGLQILKHICRLQRRAYFFYETGNKKILNNIICHTYYYMYIYYLRFY